MENLLRLREARQIAPLPSDSGFCLHRCACVGSCLVHKILELSLRHGSCHCARFIRDKRAIYQTKCPLIVKNMRGNHHSHVQVRTYPVIYLSAGASSLVVSLSLSLCSVFLSQSLMPSESDPDCVWPVIARLSHALHAPGRPTKSEPHAVLEKWTPGKMGTRGESVSQAWTRFSWSLDSRRACQQNFFFLASDQNSSGKGWDGRARTAGVESCGAPEVSAFGGPCTHALESATLESEDVQCLKHLELCSWKLDCGVWSWYHLVSLSVYRLLVIARLPSGLKVCGV